MHPFRKLREAGGVTTELVKPLLAEHVVFNSPVLVRAVEGRDLIAGIFSVSGWVKSERGSGAYVAEHTLDERTTFLDWLSQIDGHKIESVELIVDNEQG
jgi:hypothetical protein